jgi:hypothetical protein
MRLQKITLLTGTVLSLFVSAGIVHPAMANPAGEIAQRDSMSTSSKTEMITGVIKSIAGELVTVDIDGGTYRTLRIERRMLGILGLVPGVKISATVMRGGMMVENVAVIPNVKVTASQSAIRSTITTTTRTQVQTTPTLRPLAPAPMRPVTQPVSRPQMAPVQMQPVPAPVQMQPAATPVRGLW